MHGTSWISRRKRRASGVLRVCAYAGRRRRLRERRRQRAAPPKSAGRAAVPRRRRHTFGAACLHRRIHPPCVPRVCTDDMRAPMQVGWSRVYFSHLMTPAEVDYVIRAVLEVAREAWQLLPQYDIERRSGGSSSCCN